MFNIRQKGDYKELVKLSKGDATEHVNLAKEFLKGIKDFIDKTIA